MRHVPKKLTDCPENLRESIDWLIQVRYGNGEGDGLTQLSEALKKLIEEAISNATNSLNDRQSKLLCTGKDTDKPSDSSSSDPPVKPCCQEKDEEIKDAEKKMNGLKSSSTEESEKQIDEQNAKIKKAEASKNDCAKSHYLPEEERTKGLDEVKQQKKIVEKLKTFAESLTKTGEKNNILTHLCSGLETFLGFDPTSKGYTGQGIVYSDLDRLCDGVMAFLSGVLSNIKEHLGQHKETITDAIEALKQNKHLGKNGFNAAIGKVVAGVGRYNKEVKKSNDEVKEAVEKLQQQVNDAFVDGVKEILKDRFDEKNNKIEHTDQEVRAAETFINGKVENCERNASAFKTSLSVHSETVNNFDSVLRDRVRNVDKSVEHEKTRLRKVVDKERENFSAMEKQVENTLNDLKCNVNKKIKVNVEKLVEQFKEVVGQIRDKLDEVNRNLIEYVEELERWIEDADGVLKAALAKIEEILQGDSTKYAMQVEATAQQIARDAESLHNDVEVAREKVKALVKDATDSKVAQLDGWKTEAESVVSAAKEKCKQILEKVHHAGGEQNTEIGKNAEDLKKKAAALLKAYEKAHAAVDTLAKSTVTAAIEDLEENIKTDLYTIKEGIKSGLKQVINAFKTGIAKAMEDDRAALFVQEFSLGLGGRGGDAPKLYAWADAIKNSSELKDAIGNLQRKSNAFEDFKNILKQLEQNQSSAGIFYEVLNEDLDGKVDGKLTGAGRGGSKVKLSVLGTYEKNKKPGSRSKYQTLVTTDIPDALKEFKQMDAFKGKEDINKGTVAESTKTVDDAFQMITTQLKEIAGLVDSEKKQVKPENGKKDGVNNYMSDLERMLQKEPSVTFESMLTPPPTSVKGLVTIKEEITAALGEIEDEVTAALSGTTKTYAEITAQTYTVSGQMNALCSAINEAAGKDPTHGKYSESAKAKLLELKEKIGKNTKKQLEGIHEHLKTLQTTLEKESLSKLNYFLTTYANKSCQNIIEPLNKQVNGEIADAQTKIVTAARKQYVTTVQFLIYEFVNKVRSELDGLPTQIDADIAQGYKGFMTKMENPLLTRLNRIEGIKSDVFTTESSPLKEAAIKFKGALTAFFIQLNRQPDLTTDYQKIRPTQKALEQLLTGLEASRHFDAVFAQNLDALNETLSRFHATTYGEGKNPYLLEAFRRAFAALVGELGKAYVSRYSKTTIDWKRITKAEQDKYAKICLSATPILFSAVKEFVEHLEDAGGKWQSFRMYPSTQSDSSLHALFLNENGYDVGLPVNSSQGTLNHRSDFTGRDVFNHLTGGTHKLFESNDSSIISSALRSGSHVIPVQYTDHEGLIPELHGYLGLYFNVSHLIFHPKPKSPCSVYEMLLWCAGLQFNPVYDKLESYFKELFPKPKELGGEPYSKIDPAQLSFVATTTIQPKQLSAALHEICSQSYAVVTAILGHGHADGLYACDIANNSLTLHYPAVPSQCFDTLVELLLRMYQQLHFLYEQCSRGHVFGAWNKCWYGQGVAGSAATCNDLQCPDQTCNQKHNQNGNQNCKQHAECGLKSPLQSFLEDGLQGFLPHHVTKVGCGITCAISNHKGIPCRTPMGFSDLSIKASHRQRGKYLEDVLADLCGKPHKPLSQFCSLVTCLLQRTPQTLGDMFAFYYNLLDKWNSNDGHKRHAFVNAVQQANFGDTKTTLEISPLFGHTDHTSETHPNADLYSLVKCEYNGGDAALPCGPYLRPLVRDIYNTFSAKNASRYLSWVVYLTETFYDLLKKLYDDCCATCDKQGTRCHDKSCAEKCKVTYTDEKGNFSTPSKTTKHGKECSSIVKCPYTLSTLCRYGFYFESSWRMSGERSAHTKRTCRDLCRALEKMLSKKESDGAALATLIYKTIPEFLFKIRAPFIWLNVALWLLSLLYLIHIMVIRLDLLHIKSHLRSPSSHRIAAQSLLAAARVNKLGRVFYLQP